MIVMPFTKAREDFITAIEKVLPQKIKILDSEITIPPETIMGDLSFPVFALAKKLKKNPSEVAADILAKIKARGLLDRVEARGPYVNVFLNRFKFAQEVLDEIKKYKAKYGFKNIARIKNKKPVILEFVSPNTNKPLHLGHLRNAFLGRSLARLLLSQGEKVICSILYNDRGINIMKSMLAYIKSGHGDAPKSKQEKGDHFVGRYYVMFGNLLKDDPSLQGEAQADLLKWEKGDKTLRALWKKMNKWAEDGFRETLERIGVSFTSVDHESALYKKGQKIVFDAFKKGIFVRDEKGNIIAPLEKFNLPNKVMLRADGTAVYATTDISLIRERWRKHRFGRLIYVVGMEQDLHFKQLFKIFELLKEPYAHLCEHLSYNWVYLPEGRMKSREGLIVDADALLDELRSLAQIEIKSRYKFLPKKEVGERAEAIAQAALKYYFLEVDPKSDIHFNPAASLAFSGRTGPYIQYSFARISSLLKKAGGRAPKAVLPDNFSEKEYRLLLLLSKYGETLTKSSAELNPAELAKYLFELARAFSDFYESEPVLKAPANLIGFRLVLSKSVAGVLSSGLGLLGIKAPEEM